MGAWGFVGKSIRVRTMYVPGSLYVQGWPWQFYLGSGMIRLECYEDQMWCSRRRPWPSVESVVDSHGLQAGRWDNRLYRKWGPYSGAAGRRGVGTTKSLRMRSWQATEVNTQDGHDILQSLMRQRWEWTGEVLDGCLRWKRKRAKKYIKLFLSTFWSGTSCYPEIPGTLYLWASANLPPSGNAAGMESLQALSCEPLKGRDFILCITASQSLALRLSHSWCSISICLFCTFI